MPHSNSHQLATCFRISSIFPFTFRSTIFPPINLSSIVFPSFSIDTTDTCFPFSTYVRDFFLLYVPNGLEVYADATTLPSDLCEIEVTDNSIPNLFMSHSDHGTLFVLFCFCFTGLSTPHMNNGPTLSPM